MLTDEQCRGCAADLLNAARTRAPMVAPGVTFPGMTTDDAYAIQRAWVRARLAAGGRLVGYKIGLTSRATQTAWQATEPMYGRMLDDGVLPDGARVSAAAFHEPKLEVELALVLGADLEGPGVSAERVLDATERVVPAFEIVARRTDALRSLADAIADNAAFGAIVLGSHGLPAKQIDLGAVSATLEKNGVSAESGTSSSVMGNPAEAVVWLATRLHAAGERLLRGQVILTGTLTRATQIVAGDSFRADYGPLGTLSVTFD